MALYFLINTLM
ncbi:uncharacterized protein FFC1_15912 [Fusarium fujikuroi]|nr:uncharacterized protein FFC1_15912 [Fusarium fujikuroi]